MRKGRTLLTDDSTSSPEGVEHLEDLAAERDTAALRGVQNRTAALRGT